MTKAYEEEPRRGPFATAPSDQPFRARGNVVPASGPLDPRQRIVNGRIDPEPYVDLQVAPNITGTYFERKGRFRLFINHVGGHVECLLTLVTKKLVYHKGATKLDADVRLPFDWGIAGYLARPDDKRPDPIAFRFAGDQVGGTYMLSVPVWLGEQKIPLSDTTDGTYDIGFVDVRSGGDELDINWLGWFIDRWPEAEEQFGVSTPCEGLATRAIRDSRQPVLLDRYFARSSVSYAARTHYWFSPTPQQRKGVVDLAREVYRMRVRVKTNTGGYILDEKGEGGELLDLFELVSAGRDLGMGGAASLQREEIVRCIDELIFKVFTNAIAAPLEHGGISVSEVGHLRVQVLRILDGWMLDPSEEHGNQSIGTALQRIVDRVSAGKDNFRRLEKYLELKPRGWRKFRYEVEVTLFQLIDFEDPKNDQVYKKGKELWAKIKETLKKKLGEKYARVGKFNAISKYLPFSHIVGHMRVKYSGIVEGETGGPSDEPWEAYYAVALGGIQLKKSMGGSVSFKIAGPTEIWAGTPPNSKELEGRVMYTEGAAVVGINLGTTHGSFSGSAGAGKSMLTLFGGKSSPSVAFVFDGELGGNSVGGSIGGRALFGEAWLLDGQDSKITLEPKNMKEETGFDQYWKSHIPTLAVHFPIDGARLPVPTEAEEKVMQEKALISVKQALNAFAACELALIANPSARIRIEGYADPPGRADRNLLLSQNRAVSVQRYLAGLVGERLTFGLSDEALNASGRMVAVGKGEPPADPATATSEEFDPTERRTDVIVGLDDVLADGSDAISVEWRLLRDERLLPK